MKKVKMKTDDMSFALYLAKLDYNTIFEHARENILSDCMVDVIMNKEHLFNDCYTIVFKDLPELPHTLKVKFLKEELEATNEEEIQMYVNLLFSKKELIDMMLEYLDEDARINLIENQTEWEKPNYDNINLN